MHNEVMVIKYSGEPRSEPHRRMLVNDEEWILSAISVTCCCVGLSLNKHYVEETWERYVDYLNEHWLCRETLKPCFMGLGEIKRQMEELYEDDYIRYMYGDKIKDLLREGK